MAIVYENDTAYLNDVCTIEEGEQFFEWIKNTEDPKVDFKNTEHIHTAIFQTILFFKPTLLNLDKESFLGKLLG